VREIALRKNAQPRVDLQYFTLDDLEHGVAESARLCRTTPIPVPLRAANDAIF
jgi:hypothetical protein